MRFSRLRPSPLSPDPDLIRTLSRLLEENGLTEIEYAVGDRLVRVSRATSAAAATPRPISPEIGVAAQQSTAVSISAAHPGAVTAPMIGTVFLAPQPGAPRFVRVGEMVAPGQPLLIIEAMKVMNEIRAPCAGRIAQIMVEDAQPVEYGMVLLVIE